MPDGSYLHVAPDGSAGGPYYILRYAPNGTRLDSIPLPNYANRRSSAWYPTSKRGGRMLRGLNYVPFGPVSQWDATPRGTVVSGDAKTYRLVETGRLGEVVRDFSRPFKPDPVPRAERAESLRALTRRLDSVPVPMHLVQDMPDEVRRRRMPTMLPAYQGVFAEVDDRVWIRRWPNERQRGQSVFDVFDGQRRYVHTVVLPTQIANEPTPVLRADYIVAVVVDADGSQRVVRFARRRAR